MIEWLPIVVFVGIQILGAAIFIQWMRGRWLPLPRPHDPRYVFHFVHREDRAAYVRVMRRSSAVQLRDLGRSFDQFGRTIEKQLLPPLRKLADALEGWRKPT